MLTGGLDPLGALERYRALLATCSGDERLTFDGVEDRSRVDSYYDPFGNLAVEDRLMVLAGPGLPGHVREGNPIRVRALTGTPH